MHRFVLQLTLVSFLYLVGCSDSNQFQPTPPPDGPSSWRIAYNEFGVNFREVFFLDAATGWIVGSDNIILSTASGGLLWSEAPVNTFSEILNGVHFVTTQNGWLASDLNGTSPAGRVLRSINGGAYPETQLLVSGPMYSVFFADQQQGWAVGSGGLVAKTVDGGLNWEQEILENAGALYSVKFVSPQKGWISGQSGGIYRTLDGITWQKQELDVDADILSMHFVDSLNGWACGTGNTVLRWRSSGGQPASWSARRIEGELINQQWRDIFFVDEENGWLVGQSGRIYKSTDGGENWVLEITEAQGMLNSVHMISTRRGWIVGNNGLIIEYAPR